MAISSGASNTTASQSPPAAPRDQLPRPDRHRPKGTPRPSRRARWRALVLLLVHVAIGLHVLHWLASGETISPVEPSESMQTLEEGRVNAGFVLFVVLIAGTLVFGRWFCGWACHVVALQDLSAWLLGRVGLRPRPVRSRLLVLAPFVVAGHMFVWPQIERRLWSDAPPLPKVGDWQLELQTQDFWLTFPGWIMAIGTFLVVGFLIVWWLGAKGFCTYGCPYGAVFGVVDRFSTGRIRVTDACEHCGHCTQTCTSNVRVHEEVARYGMVVDPGCMKCMDCVNVCPKDALYYGFGKVKPLVVSQQRIAARADFTWPEEVALAVVAFVATQWVWRGAWFGEPVPFLMAVGLGVITAAFVMVAWRLLRRREFAFQHTPLRQAGKLTAAGRRGVVLLGVFFALVLHTAFVQFLAGRASAELEIASDPGQSSEARAEATFAARDWLERQAAWTLLPNPGVHQSLALVYRQGGEFDRAERELRRALELAPGFPQAAIGMSMFLEQRGEWQQVVDLLSPLLELSPRRFGTMQRAGVHVRLGRAFAETQRLDEAAAAFRAALALVPDWPEAALSLVRVLSLQERWDEAEQLLEEQLAARPGFEPYTRALADVRARRSR